MPEEGVKVCNGIVVDLGGIVSSRPPTCQECYILASMLELVVSQEWRQARFQKAMTTVLTTDPCMSSIPSSWIARCLRFHLSVCRYQRLYR